MCLVSGFAFTRRPVQEVYVVYNKKSHWILKTKQSGFDGALPLSQDELLALKSYPCLGPQSCYAAWTSIVCTMWNPIVLMQLMQSVI